MKKGLEKSVNGNNITLIEIIATGRDKAVCINQSSCHSRQYRDNFEWPQISYLKLKVQYKCNF